MENLKQFGFQRRLMILLDNLINMAQQRVEAVPLFYGFIDQMHHSPIQLHLLLQIALQGPHKIIKALQSHLHLLRINLIVHINLLLGLNSSLPILLLVIGLIGPQMKIYLIAWFPLLLQNLKPLLIWQVNLQILLTVSISIAIEPLKKDNIIVKLSFANLLEGERLCDFKFFQGIFDKFDISIIILGVFGGEIQFEYIDGARMYCVYHLRIGNSIAQTLYRSILCLHQSVYPLQQLIPSQVHLNLQQQQYIQAQQLIIWSFQSSDYCPEQIFLFGIFLDQLHDLILIFNAFVFDRTNCLVLLVEFNNRDFLHDVWSVARNLILF